MHAVTVALMLVCVTVVGRGHGATGVQRQDRWFGPHGPRKSCARTGIIYEAARGGMRVTLSTVAQRLELFGPFQGVGGVQGVRPGGLSAKNPHEKLYSRLRT